MDLKGGISLRYLCCEHCIEGDAECREGAHLYPCEDVFCASHEPYEVENGLVTCTHAACARLDVEDPHSPECQQEWRTMLLEYGVNQWSP